MQIIQCKAREFNYIMKKMLFVLSSFCAISACAKGEFLVVSEEAIMNTILLKDYRTKIRKFMEKLEEAKMNAEKKLKASRVALEKIKNTQEFAKKEAEWQKQVEAYELKVATISQAAEEATKESGEKINGILNGLLSDISKKHGGKAIFKEGALAYLPSDYENVTGELVETLNKSHKSISISLPMVSLD